MPALVATFVCAFIYLTVEYEVKSIKRVGDAQEIVTYTIKLPDFTYYSNILRVMLQGFSTHEGY